MNTKNNRARKHSQEKLMAAYLELMDLYSIENISVKMLINTAKVNRSTFYNNYQDMNDFIVQIVKNIDYLLFSQLKQNNLIELSLEQQIFILNFIR